MMKGKKKQQMIKYCCFFWTQEPILKPTVFWPKFGFDEPSCLGVGSGVWHRGGPQA